MPFYQPSIAQVTSWTFAAVPGESLNRSVNIPPVSTTQAMLFAAYTAVTTSSAFGGGGGTYRTLGGTLLSGGMDMDTSSMTGSPQRYAHCGLEDDAVNIAAGTSFSPYLAAGMRYDFVLGTSIPNPLNVNLNAVLTIVVFDGPGTWTPSTRRAATGSSSTNYNPTYGTGTSTGSVNVWLDAFYSSNVHLISSWNARASGLPNGHWWSAGDAYQPPAHGLPGVYHSVAVAALTPVSGSATASPVTYALDASEQWAIMAYESNLVLSTPAPPPAATYARLATIVG